MKNAGARIREARRRAGYQNQTDFARALGTSKRQVVRWETGKHHPQAAWRDRIIEVTGDPTLFDDEDDDVSQTPYDDLRAAVVELVNRLEAVERREAA